MGNTAAHQLQAPSIPPEAAPVYRPGPWLRPSGWVSFLLGALTGVGWLAALIVNVGGAELFPFLPNALWLRLALTALLLAVAPLVVLTLARIKRQRATQHTRATRFAFLLAMVLTLLCLIPAMIANTQLPQAGATVDSLFPTLFAFIFSPPALSLGVALGVLTAKVRNPAPAVVAACGFGFVSTVLGVIGVITTIIAPAPDCTGQHLGCGAIANALIGETLVLVCFGSFVVFILALIEGVLGYWLSTVLTEWLQARYY